MRFMICLISILAGLAMGGLLFSVYHYHNSMQEFNLQASPSLASVMNPTKFNP